MNEEAKTAIADAFVHGRDVKIDLEPNDQELLEEMMSFKSRLLSSVSMASLGTALHHIYGRVEWVPAEIDNQSKKRLEYFEERGEGEFPFTRTGWRLVECD